MRLMYVCMYVKMTNRQSIVVPTPSEIPTDSISSMPLVIEGDATEYQHFPIEVGVKEMDRETDIRVVDGPRPNVCSSGENFKIAVCVWYMHACM